MSNEMQWKTTRINQNNSNNKIFKYLKDKVQDQISKKTLRIYSFQFLQFTTVLLMTKQ